MFGGADYRHAVTDDIAAYAGISKGLLFHYFGNKRGLYQYAFDYCLRFIAQAANRAIPEGKMDFFAITLQCEHATVSYTHLCARYGVAPCDTSVARTYPDGASRSIIQLNSDVYKRQAHSAASWRAG